MTRGENAARASYAHWVLQPDLPDSPTAPRYSVFVCGTQRAGTWLLSGLLDSTEVAGRPHQYFGAETRRANERLWHTSGFHDYVKRVVDAGTTPNGVFGCKLMWPEMRELLERLGDEDSQSTTSPGLATLQRHFPHPRFLWIRREQIAQAVSWAKAIQTGYWHHWNEPTPAATPTFDFVQIDALAEEIAQNERAWQSWFAANRIEPVVVRYEELAADPARIAREALAILGIDFSGTIPAVRTVRVGDSINEAWIARYRAQADNARHGSSRGQP